MLLLLLLLLLELVVVWVSTWLFPPKSSTKSLLPGNLPNVGPCDLTSPLKSAPALSHLPLEVVPNVSCLPSRHLTNA